MYCEICRGHPRHNCMCRQRNSQQRRASSESATHGSPLTSLVLAAGLLSTAGAAAAIQEKPLFGGTSPFVPGTSPYGLGFNTGASPSDREQLKCGPVQVCVNCGALTQTQAAYSLAEKGVTLAGGGPGCHVCYNYDGPPANHLTINELHCLETFPFVVEPGQKGFFREKPGSVNLALSSHPDHTSVIAESIQKGYQITTASLTNAIYAAELTQFFEGLRNYDYFTVMRKIYERLITPAPTFNRFNGLYVLSAPNVDREQGPLSLWTLAMRPYQGELTMTVWRHAIFCIGAPNNEELYDWAAFAPGGLAAPISKRNIYADPKHQPKFFQRAAEERNEDFSRGMPASSFIAPQIAGFAARIAEKTSPFGWNSNSSLSGFGIKALMYFFTIAHAVKDDINSPKKGKNAGVRFLGLAQQKKLAEFINSQISLDEVKTIARYAIFCYQSYELNGFDNDIYDLWINRYSLIKDKLKVYYEQWKRTRDRKQADQNYDLLVWEFFNKNREPH